MGTTTGTRSARNPRISAILAAAISLVIAAGCTGAATGNASTATR